jgi:hypothetical protein
MPQLLTWHERQTLPGYQPCRKRLRALLPTVRPCRKRRGSIHTHSTHGDLSGVVRSFRTCRLSVHGGTWAAAGMPPLSACIFCSRSRFVRAALPPSERRGLARSPGTGGDSVL